MNSAEFTASFTACSIQLESEISITLFFSGIPNLKMLKAAVCPLFKNEQDTPSWKAKDKIACELVPWQSQRGNAFFYLPALFSHFFLDSCDTAYPLTINRQKSSQSDHWQYQRAAVQLAIRFLPADSTPIPQRLLNCFSRFVSGIAEPTKEITRQLS